VVLLVIAIADTFLEATGCALAHDIADMIGVALNPVDITMCIGVGQLITTGVADWCGTEDTDRALVGIALVETEVEAAPIKYTVDEVGSDIGPIRYTVEEAGSEVDKEMEFV
jgi:hypothetical protein